MSDLKFVNKACSNPSYEWGRNCITLGYTLDQTKKSIDSFPDMSATAADHFWEGYNAGPRENNEVYSIDNSTVLSQG